MKPKLKRSQKTRMLHLLLIIRKLIYTSKGFKECKSLLSVGLIKQCTKKKKNKSSQNEMNAE